MFDSMLVLIAAALLLAGFIKGVLGLGLPTVSMGLLAVTMPPGKALAIVIVPAIVTNIWQTFFGPYLRDITRRLWAFYRWCADANIPELTTLAETIETWWPAIEVFLTTGLTNARTEGTNRLIKQVKRADTGFRNRENYRRRVRLHCTRHTRRLSARQPTVPA